MKDSLEESTGGRDDTIFNHSQNDELTEVEERAHRFADLCVRVSHNRSREQRLTLFANDLQSIRWEREMSREDLADHLGLPPATVCFLENGLGRPEELLQHIRPWATALSLDPDQYTQNLQEIIGNDREKTGRSK